MRMPSFSLKYCLVSVALAAAVSWPTATLSGLSFWASFAIAVAALMINGLVAEVEDRLPGGFLNPGGRGKKDVET